MSTSMPRARLLRISTIRFVTVVGVMLPTAAAVCGQAEPAPTDRSYFGAPVLEYTRLRGQDALMLGGRGGWGVTPSLTLGGALFGTLTEVDAPRGAVTISGEPLDLKLEMFGVELGYAMRPAAPTHLTLGALVGGAAARYVRDGTNEQDGETDFLLLIEPSVGLEQSIHRRVHAHLAFSYRFIGETEQRGLRARHLDGPALAFALKVGRFP